VAKFLRTTQALCRCRTRLTGYSQRWFETRIGMCHEQVCEIVNKTWTQLTHQVMHVRQLCQKTIDLHRQDTCLHLLKQLQLTPYLIRCVR
jgi:hypothetical protein